jgi:hypothetical protein
LTTVIKLNQYLGSFSETSSQDEQLYWMIENCTLFRQGNGLGIITDALRLANAKHDLLHNWTELELLDLKISSHDKGELLEEICTEISIYLGLVYHVVELLKGEDPLAEELSNLTFLRCNQNLIAVVVCLEPPLPVLLFGMIASLKDKSPKGYPVKKVSS